MFRLNNICTYDLNDKGCEVYKRKKERSLIFCPFFSCTVPVVPPPPYHHSFWKHDKMEINPETIENLGFELRCNNKPRSVQTSKKRFKALYETYPEVIFYIWNQLIIEKIIENLLKNVLRFLILGK